MADDGSTGEQQGTEGQEQGQEQQGKPGEVKLTSEQQAHVDGVIARRLEQERKRLDGEVEKKVQERLERSKMDAAQRAEAERDEARKEAEKVTSGSKRAVAEARVETALLAAGIKADRLEKLARLVNLDDVAGSDDPKAAAAEQVRQVLADYPEFRPTVGQSGGEMSGGGNGTITLEQFRKMDAEQLAELDRKDPALFSRLSEQDLGPEQ